MTVIVVGAGLAGLCCTLECLSKGQEVVLVEKDTQIGGNSVLASTGINGFDNNFYSQSVSLATENGKYTLEPYTKRMLKLLVDNSANSIKWLEELGVKFKRRPGQSLGVKSNERVGSLLVSVIEKRIHGFAGLSVLTGVEVKGFQREGSRVTGVIGEKKNGQNILLQGPVVLTTGAFGNLKKYVTKYRPDLQSLSLAANNTSSEAVIEEAIECSAKLVDMCNYQLLPTGLVRAGENPAKYSGTMVPTLSMPVFQKGTLMVDGKVVYSGGDYPNNQILCEEMDKAGHGLFLLAERQSRQFKTMLKALKRSGFIQKFRNVDKVVDAFRMQEKPDIKGPVLAIVLVPALFIPLGGFQVDPETMEILPGVYSAGEALGGVHGRQMIVGSSLLSCVVFGRRTAQKLCKKFPSTTPSNTTTAQNRLRQIRNHLEGVSIPDVEISMETVKKHNSEGDCWLVLKNVVLDLTEFVQIHPGGVDILVENAGTDITDNFEAFHDDSIVLRYARKYIIGRLEGAVPYLGKNMD